jgi:hypothetical protein
VIKIEIVYILTAIVTTLVTVMILKAGAGAEGVDPPKLLR